MYTRRSSFTTGANPKPPNVDPHERNAAAEVSGFWPKVLQSGGAQAAPVGFDYLVMRQQGVVGKSTTVLKLAMSRTSLISGDEPFVGAIRSKTE